MNPPAGWPLDAPHIGSSNQRSHDIPDSVDQIVPNTTGIIIPDEAFQAAMTNAPDSHSKTYAITVRSSRPVASFLGVGERDALIEIAEREFDIDGGQRESRIGSPQ